MKKILCLITMLLLATPVLASNYKSLTPEQQVNADKIILSVLKKTEMAIDKGKGPFYAVIVDSNGKIVAEAANSVIECQCCENHAEMNAIKEACKNLKTYDLAPYNLSIYISAEPCIMCTGAIMWSGIKNVYYSVSSKDVEKITGFDEGFKPNWVKEFKKRGINVYGNIQEDAGKAVLEIYMAKGKTVYKPSR